MNLIKRLLKKISIYFSRKEQLKKAEYKRLKKLPRFHPTTTSLLDHKISIVDSKLFFLGKEEIFDQRIYEFKSSTPVPLVIDCGANIGLSIIFIKQLYPNAKVIAFEPDPNIYQYLMNNIESFNLKDVDLRNQAVWTNNGMTSFFPEGGFSGRIPLPGDAQLINVPCARLRDFLKSSVEFLKIDIEGAETDVIIDCADLLGNVTTLFVEYHSHISKPQKLAELLQVLSNAGFRYHIKEAFTSSKPFINHENMLGMDLQLNIFCYRD